MIRLLRVVHCLSMGYITTDKPFRAVELFEQMHNKGVLRTNQHETMSNPSDASETEAIERNWIVFLCVINALSHIADVSVSELVVRHIRSLLHVNHFISNALINMCVCMCVCAKFMFTRALSIADDDAYHGKNGCVDRANEVFQRIAPPDHIGYATMSTLSRLSLTSLIVASDDRSMLTVSVEWAIKQLNSIIECRENFSMNMFIFVFTFQD
jgi:hypothetical protein